MPKKVIVKGKTNNKKQKPINPINQPEPQLAVIETKPRVLDQSGKTIRTVYHISDIHIDNKNTRYDEYRNVFKRLYAEIRKDVADFLDCDNG